MREFFILTLITFAPLFFAAYPPDVKEAVIFLDEILTTENQQ